MNVIWTQNHPVYELFHPSYIWCHTGDVFHDELLMYFHYCVFKKEGGWI